MKRRMWATSILLLAAALAGPHARTQEQIRPAYTADYVAQMVDYVSRDYAGAVTDGKVSDPDEYAEQLNVIAAALEVSGQVPALAARPEIGQALQALIATIRAVAPEPEVRNQAQALRNQILAAGGGSIAPARWPSLARGRALFAARCVVCHGAAGDGAGPAGGSRRRPPISVTPGPPRASPPCPPTAPSATASPTPRWRAFPTWGTRRSGPWPSTWPPSAIPRPPGAPGWTPPLPRCG